MLDRYLTSLKSISSFLVFVTFFEINVGGGLTMGLNRCSLILSNSAQIVLEVPACGIFPTESVYQWRQPDALVISITVTRDAHLKGICFVLFIKLTYLENSTKKIHS